MRAAMRAQTTSMCAGSRWCSMHDSSSGSSMRHAMQAQPACNTAPSVGLNNYLRSRTARPALQQRSSGTCDGELFPVHRTRINVSELSPPHASILEISRKHCSECATHLRLLQPTAARPLSSVQQHEEADQAPALDPEINSERT